jgi:hypothetical protein
LRSSSQRTNPYWSAGEKTAKVIAAIARGAIRRVSESSVVALGSLSIASPLYGARRRRTKNAQRFSR